MKIISLCFLLLLFSCAKDREETFPQGQGGEDLLRISDYDNKEFNAKATKSVNALKVSSAITNEVNDKKVEVVNVETNASLLTSDSLFLGRVGKSYKIKYKITDSSLKILKICSKDDLHADEIGSAKAIENNLFEVEVGHYDISLFSVENKEDANGDKTHVLSEVSESRKEESTHFRFKNKRFNNANWINKINHFRSEYFKGDWILGYTIIDADPKVGLSQGLQVDAGKSRIYQNSRINFIKTKNGYEIIGRNHGDFYNKNDNFKKETVATIPGEWKEYRMKIKGGQETSEEEEVILDSKDAKPLDQRNIVKLDLNKFSMGIFPNTNDKVLNELIINEDYFSFVIDYKKSKIKIRVSFKKVGEPKDFGRPYYASDFKYFGLFKTLSRKGISVKEDGELTKHLDEAALDRQSRISKFFPKDNVITYHFSKRTPKEKYIRDAARNAIKLWNNVFNEIGIRVVLDESMDVDLGDIRYNIINMPKTILRSGSLGYGPTVTDPLNGEVHSASTNIYVSPILDSIYSSIRKLILSKIGLLNKNYTRKKPFYVEQMVNQVENQIQGDNSKSSILLSSLASSSINYSKSYDFETINKLKSELIKDGKYSPLDIYNLYGFQKALTTNPDRLVKLHSEQEKFYQVVKGRSELLKNKEHDRHCSFSAAYGGIIEKIEKKCTNLNSIAQKVVASYQNTAKISIDEFSKDINECAEKVVSETLTPIVLHELGHNFGLRHNFMGSRDIENYYTSEELGGKKIYVSSVMDYVDFSQYALDRPGKYDIAAIKYAYANLVETTNGKMIKLNNKPIDLHNNRFQRIKKYKFCTDGEARGAIINSECIVYDYGRNSVEVVENYIDSFYSYLETGMKRFDKSYLSSASEKALSITEAFFLPMYRIYVDYRELLVSLGKKYNFAIERISKDKDLALKVIPDLVKSNPKILHELQNAKLDEYLLSVNAKNFDAIITILSRIDKINGQKLIDLHIASRRMAEFFIELSFMNDHYCLVQLPETTLVAPRLLKEFRDVYELPFRTCSDPYLKQLEKRSGNLIVGEFGADINDVGRSRSGLDHSVKEVVGTKYFKAFASQILTGRFIQSYEQFDKGLRPSFIDDPVIYSQMLQKVMDRIVVGLDISKLKLPSEELKVTVPYVADFKTEVENIANFMYNMRLGLGIPDNANETIKRRKAFQTFNLRTSYINDPSIVLVDLDGISIGTTTESPVSFNLLQHYNRLNRLETLIEMDGYKVPTKEQLIALRKKMLGEEMTDEKLKTLKIDELLYFLAGKYGEDNKVIQEGVLNRVLKIEDPVERMYAIQMFGGSINWAQNVLKRPHYLNDLLELVFKGEERGYLQYYQDENKKYHPLLEKMFLRNIDNTIKSAKQDAQFATLYYGKSEEIKANKDIILKSLLFFQRIL